MKKKRICEAEKNINLKLKYVEKRKKINKKRNNFIKIT